MVLNTGRKTDWIDKYKVKRFDTFDFPVFTPSESCRGNFQGFVVNCSCGVNFNLLVTLLGWPKSSLKFTGVFFSEAAKQVPPPPTHSPTHQVHNHRFWNIGTFSSAPEIHPPTAFPYYHDAVVGESRGGWHPGHYFRLGSIKQMTTFLGGGPLQ